MAVSDPQNISGYAVACAGQGELLDGAFESVTANTSCIGLLQRLCSELMQLQSSEMVQRVKKQAAFYPEFLSLSQLSKASLLKAAAAAMLLLVSWMLAIVSADDTTSIRPARSPVARQP